MKIIDWNEYLLKMYLLFYIFHFLWMQTLECSPCKCIHHFNSLPCLVYWSSSQLIHIFLKFLLQAFLILVCFDYSDDWGDYRVFTALWWLRRSSLSLKRWWQPGTQSHQGGFEAFQLFSAQFVNRKAGKSHLYLCVHHPCIMCMGYVNICVFKCEQHIYPSPNRTS